jgi:hypothetical protein
LPTPGYEPIALLQWFLPFGNVCFELFPHFSPLGTTPSCRRKWHRHGCHCRRLDFKIRKKPIENQRQCPPTRLPIANRPSEHACLRYFGINTYCEPAHPHELNRTPSIDRTLFILTNVGISIIFEVQNPHNFHPQSFTIIIPKTILITQLLPARSIVDKHWPRNFASPC